MSKLLAKYDSSSSDDGYISSSASASSVEEDGEHKVISAHAAAEVPPSSPLRATVHEWEDVRKYIIVYIIHISRHSHYIVPYYLLELCVIETLTFAYKIIYLVASAGWY